MANPHEHGRERNAERPRRGHWLTRGATRSYLHACYSLMTDGGICGSSGLKGEEAPMTRRPIGLAAAAIGVVAGALSILVAADDDSGEPVDVAAEASTGEAAVLTYDPETTTASVVIAGGRRGCLVAMVVTEIAFLAEGVSLRA